MSTIPLRTEHDRQQAIKRIENADLPSTLSIKKGAPRSLDQNRLQQMWNMELAEQGDMAMEEYRAYNKLHFGVPILRESGEFRQQYDTTIRPLTYEQKLEIMKAPMDFPVTRLMTVKEHKRFLDDIYAHWTGKGFRLTDPDWQGMDVK